MAKITIEELSESLKNYLDGLGLTETQVQNLIDKMQKEVIGNKAELATSNKSSLVAAINELFQSANNGKELIANAIGGPLSSNDTFSAMSNGINGLTSNFKSILEDEGVSVTPEDKMTNLITKTDTEFNNKNTTIENARKALAGLMKEDGYNITGNEDIDSLLELLNKSNINVGDIKQIACGQNYTVILKNDGSVWACGDNSDGQLGLGDAVNRNTFTKVNKNINNDVKQIACGGHQTFILKTDGSIWSCGFNANGQLGLGDTATRKEFTKVTTNINNDVKQITCGYDHTFILKNDGSVWACGDNSDGQLGLNNNATRNTFTKVTTNINNDVKQVVCGGYHTFILKNNGSLWGCGYNNNGQLGLGDTSSRNRFTQVTNDVKQVACGDIHTIIVKTDGSAWACGSNQRGQLGLGFSGAYTTITQITNDVKQAVCGHNYTFILKNGGSVWACGSNDSGHLGLGDTSSRTIITQVTTNINNDVKQITCGYEHTFILKNDGSAWGCGGSRYGQLGLEGTTNNTLTFTKILPRDV